MSENTETIYCEECNAKLDPEYAVWLELQLGTNEWRTPGTLNPNDSQGVFPFGSACARRVLEQKEQLLDKFGHDSMVEQAECSLKESKDEMARLAKELEKAERIINIRENTTLPNWALRFIMREAYNRGHTEGQNKINEIALGMIYRAEQYQQNVTG